MLLVRASLQGEWAIPCFRQGEQVWTGCTTVKGIIILGAAGRDLHSCNVVFRDDPDYRVVAFMATQILDIAGLAELRG